MAMKNKDDRSELAERLDLEAMNDGLCGRETDDDTDERSLPAFGLPAWHKKKKHPRVKE